MKTFLKRALIAGLVWLLGRSARLVRVNWQILEGLHREGRPYLLGIWHNNILQAMVPLGGLGYPVMISRSRDGDHIAWVAERFGFRGVRGSPSTGGPQALRGALRHLGAGEPVIVTPDGPRGPRYEVKPGIVALARRKGVPIVPICLSARRRWELRSWDRMKLSKPFSTVYLFVGTPILLAEDGTDEETHRLRVQTAMRDLVRLAESFSGAEGRFPDPVLEEGGAVQEGEAGP